MVAGLHLSGWSSSLWFGPSATAPRPKNLPRYEPSHKASVRTRPAARVSNAGGQLASQEEA